MSNSNPTHTKRQSKPGLNEVTKRAKFGPDENVSGRYGCRLDSCSRCSVKSMKCQSGSTDRLNFRSAFDGVKGKTEAYSNLAKFWHGNKNQMMTTEPSVFINEAFLQANMVVATRGMWVSLQNFRDSYICVRSMTARRNELILRGMSRDDAEEFLNWVGSKSRPEKFADVPVNLFGKGIKFTQEEDTELLNFVAAQNSLFRNEGCVDWYQPRNSLMEKFHPEAMRTRFQSKFYPQIVAWKHKINIKQQGVMFGGLIDSAVIERQKDICRRWNILDVKFYSLGFPLECALSALRQHKLVNPADYTLWIRVSAQVGWSERVLIFRECIDEFLQTANPKKYADCLKFCCLAEDDLGKYLAGNFQVVEELEAATISCIKNEQFENKPMILPIKGNFTLLGVCRDSLVKVLPASECNYNKCPNLTAVDAYVFQVLKKFEATITGRQRLILHSDISRRLTAANLRCVEKLTDTQISNILSAEDSAHSDSETEQTSDQEDLLTSAPRTNESKSYSDMFCLRVLSKTEWNSIIQESCKFTNLNGLRDLDLWDRIIQMSKVRTAKSTKEIQKDFFSIVLPNLELYADEITRYNLRRKME